MDEIQKSIDTLLAKTGWQLIDGSLQVLDEKHLNWIAKATTTHLKERGEEEQTFILVVAGYTHVTLEKTGMSTLTEWCQNYHD